MKTAEKALVKKVKGYYKSPKSNASFTREENMLLERWRATKVINEAAFIDVTTMKSDHKEFLQGLDYPFSDLGEKEISKGWYMRFRDKQGIIFLRDFMTVIAFLASLYLGILKILSK